MKKAVILDFDGVVADTFEFCYMIRKKFDNTLTIEDYRKMFEGNINDKIGTGATDEERKKMNDQFFVLYEPELMKISINPGVTEVVKSLSEEFLLFIVSSTNSDIIEKFLDKYDLAHYFTEILGNDVDYSKIKKIQNIQQKYAIKAKNCVFITDTLGDIREAQKCDVKSIAVTWGYHPKETLIKGSPDQIVVQPQELIPSVFRLFGI